MKANRDYNRDLAEIRSMMERSSKFLSLSGWAGVMAGIYALAGAWVAYYTYGFKPDTINYGSLPSPVIVLALAVLVLAVVTATVLSSNKAKKRGEQVWNATSRRLLANFSIPLAAGGIFILVLLSKGLIGLIAPSTLLFYGLALYSASKFTFDDLKFLGIIQMGLGLLSSWLIAYSLIIWAIGFGVVHIVYGMFLHYRYEQ